METIVYCGVGVLYECVAKNQGVKMGRKPGSESRNRI
jgi:hypothetical protein